jgi:hypothetical protein
MRKNPTSGRNSNKYRIELYYLSILSKLEEKTVLVVLHHKRLLSILVFSYGIVLVFYKLVILVFSQRNKASLLL